MPLVVAVAALLAVPMLCSLQLLAGGAQVLHSCTGQQWAASTADESSGA